MHNSDITNTIIQKLSNILIHVILFIHTLNRVQWNPDNTVTNRPKKFGHINEVFFTRKCMVVFVRQPKKMILITR